MEQLRANRNRRKTMKGRKSIVVLWVLVYIFTGWLGAYALETPSDVSRKGHGHHRGGFLRVLTQLNLTDAQRQDIAAILKQHREQARELRTHMFEARKGLMEAITANDPNEVAVRAASRQVADNMEQMAVLRAAVYGEIRKQLTPEQQETLQKIKADFGARMQRRIEHGMSLMDQWIDENSGQ
jgi:Spy/CpxP family protein refolding chaperone